MISLNVQWAPDVADLGTSVLHTALNVLPQGNSYGPAYDLATITSALAATCVGCFQARKTDGSYSIFAATTTKLYQYNQAGDSWMDVSRLVGGNYAVPDGSYMWFLQYRDVVICGNINDAPQAFTLSSSTNFAALGGSPPTAGAGAVVGPVIVLSQLSGDPYTIKWSGLTSETSWTLGTDSAGSQVFLDGGQVIGVAGRETGYVIQQDAVRRMQYQASGAAVFAFERIQGARGCSAAASIINIGDVTFYYGNGSFNAVSGLQSKDIGIDRVNDYFKSIAVPTTIPYMVGAVDPRQPRVAWAFKSTSADSSEVFDTLLIYDIGRDKWVQVQVSLDYLAFNGLATLGYTLDGLDIFGTLETITTSFDSSVWMGGVPAFGGFNYLHKLGFFNGSTLEATLETAETQLNPPGRAFVSEVVVYGGPAGSMVAVGGRETNTQDVATFYNPEAALGVTGSAPARCSSRYHRSKVRIPAGSSWSQIEGIDYSYSPEGGR